MRAVAHGNFWFTGRALFSYGDHYVVGYHMPATYNKDGARVTLLNTERYSSTTSGHQWSARRALPGSVCRCEVDGLDNSAIREIERSGAHAIVAKLIADVREHADKAANPRIRPATRASHLDHIQTVRNWALHFARCDTVRRDITKEQRARARAQLAELKHEPFANGEDKAGAAAYANAVNRADYAAKLRTIQGDAARYGETALTLHANGETVEAHPRLQAFDRLHAQARDYADRAGVKLPRTLATLRRKVDAIRATVEAAAHAANIAAARNQWDDSAARAREAMATGFDANVYEIARVLREAAQTLTDEPRAEDRAAFIAECQAAHAEWREQDALTRAARLLDSARTHFTENRFHYAAGTASAAQSLFRRNGGEAVHAAAIGEAGRIYQSAIAHRADEYMQRLTEWRNAVPGAVFPRDLDRQLNTEPGALLRLSADRRRIETSQGAEVPARIAGVLWQAIEDRRAGVGTTSAARPMPACSSGISGSTPSKTTAPSAPVVTSSPTPNCTTSRNGSA